MKTSILDYMSIDYGYSSPARHLKKITELANLNAKEITAATITFVEDKSTNRVTTYNITPRHFAKGCDITADDDFFATKVTRENGHIMSKADTPSNKSVFLADSISDVTIWFDTLNMWITTAISPTNGEPIFILCTPPKKPNSFSDDPYVCGYCGSLFVYEVPSEDKESCSAFFCEHCSYLSLRAKDAKQIKLFIKNYKEGETYV